MDIFNHSYLNYYTLALINVTLLVLTSGISLLFVPQKSKTTLYVILLCLSAGIVGFGYFLNQLFIEPNKFQRIFLLFVIPYSHFFPSQIFMMIPALTHRKLAKAIFIGTAIEVVFVNVLILVGQIGKPMFYDFAGHFWDIDMPKVMKIYGALILLNMVVALGIGAWRLFTCPKEERPSFYVIFLGILVGLGLPAFVNVLNKAGKVTREGYISVFCVASIIGMFMFLVGYVNKTKDRTTFMFKVVGASLVTVLVLLTYISLIVMREVEESYDSIHRSISHKNILSEPPSDLEFILEKTNGKLQYLYNPNKLPVPKEMGEHSQEKKFLDLDSKFFVVYSEQKTSEKNGSKPTTATETENEETKDSETDEDADSNEELRSIEKTPVQIQYGYSYRAYREFLHAPAKKLAYVIFIAYLFVLLGIPLFLYGTLIQPLNFLLEGLRKLRKGNLEIQIPVRVQDEIGFLSSSFNSMVDSIRDSKIKLEEYAQNLEVKVEDRTKELQVTLSQVEKLKSQQDGDYFLTTLLLKPLGINKAKDTNIKTEFFMKQKKEFKFRDVSHDIGGDICISESIFLKGKKYIVFLNADAMGKSMQGAGGILVLGAVFHSIIQRTIAYPAHSEVPPEQWMKAAFKEMHKIFESFDGSMLVSLLFGLVDDKSGLVYYINAEHPWLILYRDGKADFIESDLTFRKLGTQGQEKQIFISTFQMMPGDLLLVGSDGKDDVILSRDPATDSRLVNEDERLFLRKVEQCKGNLEEIFHVIKDQYELIDDFSLLSLQYPETNASAENERRRIVGPTLKKIKAFLLKEDLNGALSVLEQAYKKDKHQKEYINLLIKIYMKQKDYLKASEICKDFLKENEVDTNFMFKASFCFKKARLFEDAIEYAERVKLREPALVRNLVHLADLYAFTKNYKRSKKLLYRVLSVEPENKDAKKILEVVNNES